MNGDSLAEASSRHSTVCEAKVKKKQKKNQQDKKKNRKSKALLKKY